jgi:bifunctional enzyme CysN/CysC
MGHAGRVIWLTGLSGAGKSTIAEAFERRLYAEGIHSYVLDGDNLRTGLNRDLGFAEGDRVENIRRSAEVAKLMADAGLVVIVALISPFRSEREMAKDLLAEQGFSEVFIDASLEVAEERDPKGLYKKARRGELPNFTGIDSPYEAPESADLRLDTSTLSVDECVEKLRELL